MVNLWIMVIYGYSKTHHLPGGMPAVHATTRSLMGIPASANANVAWASGLPLSMTHDWHDNFGDFANMVPALNHAIFFPKQCVGLGVHTIFPENARLKNLL